MKSPFRGIGLGIGYETMNIIWDLLFSSFILFYSNTCKVGVPELSKSRNIGDILPLVSLNCPKNCGSWLNFLSWFWLLTLLIFVLMLKNVNKQIHNGHLNNISSKMKLCGDRYYEYLFALFDHFNNTTACNVQCRNFFGLIRFFSPRGIISCGFLAVLVMHLFGLCFICHFYFLLSNTA